MPAGTVTLLFSDIEGSTRLLQELGAEYASVLADHRRLLRAAADEHGGSEVDTQGDAFFFVFRRVRDALAAAAAGQRSLAAHGWPGGRTLSVRMGIHTGEPEAVEEGYVGLDVHRAARICAAANGGQVLVSAAARELVSDEEPSSVALLDLGEHRLKDLMRPQRLYRLVVDGLPDDPRPPRTLDRRRTNLPPQPTPLVGRDLEIRDLAAALADDGTRLLTLTGPGGVGKTRLALHAAAELVESFADGVYLVQLAAVRDWELVVPSVAQVLVVRETAGESLAAYLAERRVLLVLDNLEHLLAAGPAVAELLNSTRYAAALVTSQEPLRVAGERVFPVPPLPVPPPGSAEHALRYDSVSLFVERARAVRPDFVASGPTLAAVGDLCARLDGLPLAIELAAARVPLLEPAEILARLDRRFTLLTAGSRDAPHRHQTLRAMIDWSHGLLDAREQALLARLAVFAGGCTLEDAEAVVDAELDLLGSLLDKSLLRRDGGRFTMLETVREFAAERLEERGEKDLYAARHAERLVQLAEEAYARRVEAEIEYSARLELEHQNLRAALDWLAAARPEDELALAGSLGWFWHARSHLTEGRERLRHPLRREHPPTAVLARALTAAGHLAAWKGDRPEALEQLSRALELWHDLGEQVEEALAFDSLAWAHFVTGDVPGALAAAEQSLELLRDTDRPPLVTRVRITLGQMLVAAQQTDAAERLARETLPDAVARGDVRSAHFAHHYLADCALMRGDAEWELGDRIEIVFELQGVAMSCSARDPARALVLAGAAQAMLDSLGFDVSGVAFWDDLLREHLGAARAAAASDADELLAEGARLGLEAAVALTLDASAAAVGR